MSERNTKIICTIGPSSADEKILIRLISHGMDAARLNFSHGSLAFHGRTIKKIRACQKRAGRPIAILQDLQGIKIRTGVFKEGKAELKKGSEIIIALGEGTGDEKRIFVTYPLLIRDARPGDRVLLDDGLIQLRITRKTRKSLAARVLEGGIISDRKGVNLPGMKLTQESFTDKDRVDLTFGLKAGVDYAAISFVRSAEDILKVRAWMKKRGSAVPLIAKIEKPEALSNISGIIEAADGIMIARGDLGVEVSPERVPLIQKELIYQANKMGKIVITATQMLESMREHLRPTRAEAADVANAVMDGSDSLMLSAETASGLYPFQSFAMMDRIIRATEQSQNIESKYSRGGSYADALADAACRAAEDIGAKLLVAFTRSGFTARLLSKFRPVVPIMAFTPDKGILRQMSLYWGTAPRYIRASKDIDSLISAISNNLLRERIVKTSDLIVIIASSPLQEKGKTNFLKLHRIGDL